MNIFYEGEPCGSTPENVIIGIDFSDTDNVDEDFVFYMGFF